MNRFKTLFGPGFFFSMTAAFALMTKSAPGAPLKSMVNQPPVLSPIGNQTVDEGSALPFYLQGCDPDSDVVSLGFRGGPNYLVECQGWLEPPCSRVSCIFYVSFFSAGIYEVICYASDGFLVDFETVTITVNNVNRPPTLEPIGDWTIDSNQTLSFNIIASDPDTDKAAPIISALNLPEGASLSGFESPVTFSWMPSSSQAGIYNVTFIAKDESLADSEVVIISVNSICTAAVGDMNGDDSLSLPDVVLLLNCVFMETGYCGLCFADLNCDGTLNPPDVVIELLAVFTGALIVCP